MFPRMNRPPNRYSPPPSGGSGSGPAYATPIYNKPDSGSNPPPPPPKEDDDNLDEFDDLTIEELRSLLDNFKNLSKGEQMDLIRYMKKLELTDPEKVKLLKQSVKPGQKPGTRYYSNPFFQKIFFIYDLTGQNQNLMWF